MQSKQITRGMVRASKPQTLRQVSCLQATLMRVRSGEKHFWINERAHVARADHLIMAPAGLTLNVHNLPDAHGYSCEVLVLDADLLQQFRLQYAEQVLALLAHPPQLFSPIQGTMRQLWDELFAAVTRSESEPLLRHRAQGLLLALALAGLGGVLFADRETGVADRLRQTMLLQPGRDWRLAELAHQFFMGESTLRRKLDQEGHSFRKILDQVRLNTALGLLQSTQLPIGEIARQCGYASHSRFSQRFQKQFGIKPMQLRATHP